MQFESSAPISIVAGPRRSRRSRVCFITDFYREEVLDGIADFAQEAGWELNANMRFHGGFPPDGIDFDGFLVTVTGCLGDRVRNWLASRRGVPVVRMISTHFDLPYPAVEVDYESAGREGARHLLTLGQIHSAFYTINRAPDIRELMRGFTEEHQRACRRTHCVDLAALHPEVKMMEISFTERCHLLAGQLKKLPLPLAVMTHDDRRSLELVEACRILGLRVPEDVAVLGCDNCRITRLLCPVPLSSVDVNFRAVGHQAAGILEELMHGSTPSRRVVKVKPAGVVARHSTATVVTDCPEITAAVTYLRAHFREGIQLSCLARMAGMSESVFRQKFKLHVGRTAREELLLAKISHAKHLLRDTDLKLNAVATESGFSSAAHLCGVFAESCACTPNDWRKEARHSMHAGG